MSSVLSPESLSQEGAQVRTVGRVLANEEKHGASFTYAQEGRSTVREGLGDHSKTAWVS